MKSIPLIGLFLVLTALRPLAQDAVPPLINYQGRLLDGSGAPVANGNYDVAFRIWSAGTGGTLVWGRSFPVNVNTGIFNVMLGDGGSPLDGALVTDIRKAFADQERYLGITVLKGPAGPVPDAREIAPRQQLLSAPYALAANDSALLGGIPARSYAFREANDSLAARQLTVTNLTVTGQLQAASTIGGGWVPVGGIIMWSGPTNQVPAGWKLCDGQEGRPDLRDRFVLGAGRHPAGEQSGAESVALNIANLPAHAHTLGIGSVGYSASWNSKSESLGSPFAGRNNANVSLTTANTGAGQAFSILPPYYVLAFIQRVQ